MIKRLLLCSTLAITLFPTHVQAQEPVYPHYRHGKMCAYQWEEGIWKRQRMIKCLDIKTGAPGSGSYILGLAHREAGYDLMDNYAADGYGGPFQQSTRYWDSRARSYGYAGYPVTNVRANAAVSLKMAKADGSWCYDWPGTC